MEELKRSPSPPTTLQQVIHLILFPSFFKGENILCIISDENINVKYIIILD
jgi:hypothetical protein